MVVDRYQRRERESYELAHSKDIEGDRKTEIFGNGNSAEYI